MPNDSFVDYSGQSIDDYQVERLLVHRQASARYLAHDSGGTPLFIEILDSTGEQDPEVDGRFQHQMQILMQHPHPAIAPVLHVGHTESGHAYAASQYIAGPTLAEELEEWRKAEKKLPAVDALHLVRPLAQALAVVHPLGIFHPDLRPENIVLDKNSSPVLVGWGLPYQAEPPQPVGPTSLLDYASPEQRLGKPINGSSNMYSLGVILYELLAGHRPEIPISAWHIFEITNLPKEVPLKEARPGLTAVTYDLVNTCLWRQVWSRYKTIDQFIAALDDAVAAEAAPARRLPGKAAFPQIPRWLFVAVPLALLLMALTGFLLARGNSERDVVTPLPVTAVATLTPTLQPTRPVTPTAEPIESILTGEPAEPTATSAPPILLLAPEAGVEVTSDETISFNWRYAIPLAPGQQFSVQISMESDVQTLGAVSRPVSDQEYRLSVNLADWEFNAGSHQWFVTLETISDGEALQRSDQQQLIIHAITPTATPVLTATQVIETIEPTVTPVAICTPAPPSGWVVYTIQQGDYLFNLALDTGTTVERLQEVNCLTETGLGVGQRLWLPFLPPTLTPTFAPTIEPTTSSGGGPKPDTPEPEKTPPPLPTPIQPS